ncbi:hypothetical protein LCGC14_1738190 [marine sediment metagenome]|uniref:Elp3/MiaA/NifB-like radical SAM core domain-containing protein n=1 Tax=marine sediment metagenome TaxID=412755 RepID=A0A0F9JMT7_9ZZZZ
MRVGLYNLEPKYKNLALEKLRIYHQGQGDDVVDYPWPEPCDHVYASSIFTFTKKDAVPEGATIGGTGFNLTASLPPDIEVIKPHLNFGFTTRGCIRRCPFCVVPEKEGEIRVEGDLLDLWDSQSRLITVMDNNILALPDQFALVCEQAAANKVRVDFNQGLDHRLLTPELVAIMKRTSHVEYRMAFDHPRFTGSVENALTMLREGGINRCNWYVLVGYDTTWEDDLFRLNLLRDRNQRAYVQRYETHYSEPFYVALARWVNQPPLFRGMTWQQFLDHPEREHKDVKEAIARRAKLND